MGEGGRRGPGTRIVVVFGPTGPPTLSLFIELKKEHKEVVKDGSGSRSL